MQAPAGRQSCGARPGPAARVPTWLARMPRRPEWNAPPSDSRTSLSPYQLRSMTVPSGARRSSERWSPADVALVCTTRSSPPAASAGSAKSTPSAAATSARPASTSTSVTRIGGEAAQQACDAATDHPGADDGDPVAQQRCGVPEGVHGGLDRAGEDGTGGRHVLRHDGHRAGRHHVGGLVRVEAEHRAAAQLGGSLLHGADVQIAVLDRPREVPLLERSPHRGVLVRRHAAPEHQRLGAAADPRPQGAHHHVVPSRLGQRDRPDLAEARRAEPERLRIDLHGVSLPDRRTIGRLLASSPS